jgi:SAM-dependent methyltransferase
MGQALGRAFAAAPDRVAAYSANILGSLAGIAAFGLAAQQQTPPMVWFAVGLAAMMGMRPRISRGQLGATLALILLLASASARDGARHLTYWSPYYKIAYHPRTHLIETNRIGHQVLVDVRRNGPAYSLPYLLNRDAGGPPLDDVLVIGAGSGNDVAAALWHGAQTVDAVEIDPSLYRIGRIDHPNRPYADPRVAVHLDDGRRFLKTTDRHYDLIAYALVDSLLLHSGYSSLRLESFLFTEQAFRDIKARLKPGGAFVMYNAFRQGWVVGRLALLAEQVFGTRPVVLSLPHVDRIRPEDNQEGRITCLMVGLPGSPVVERVREAFQDRGAFRLPAVPEVALAADGFASAKPGSGPDGGDGTRIRPVAVVTDGVGKLPTDDWPFLYLRAPVIPALNARGMAWVGGISLAILLALAPPRSVRPSGRMFFLGAGFMLLETKGVVHMALVFGATWMVNSIVFAAILVMILFANLFVIAVRPRTLLPHYVGLAGSLGLSAVVPISSFLHLSGPLPAPASCGVIFVPIFFAGVIFAVTLRDGPRPDAALGSNVAGVILGGLAENLSLMIGFNHLILVALGFYALSALFDPPGIDRSGGVAPIGVSHSSAQLMDRIDHLESVR